ncbi:MAG: sugar phosphate isomerase/epimerase family protein [Planctomycetota bacterium]|jgi:sugar phosphate isomerase/epimerase
MKLAFTTLGCPEWDLPTALARGREMGFDGIDFRGVGPHRFDPESGRYVDFDLDITRMPAFTDGLDRTRALISDSGLEVAGLSSSVRFVSQTGADLEKMLDEGRRYIALAKELECGVVRVFGGGFDAAKKTVADARAEIVSGLKELAPAAREAGVVIALETHDNWTSTDTMRPIFEELDSPAVAALWDVNHPFRFAGEPPETTWANIGPWVRYTHFKDSVVGEDGKYHYTLQGEGTLPMREIVDVLAGGGYDGWLTLEWEKMWHPELPEARVAFPAYVATMRALLK